MTAMELAKKIEAGQAPCVVDVRSALEFGRGHIPGALHAPFLEILLRRRRLPPQREAPLVVTCEHGPRAELAKGLLKLLGYRNIELLKGHMSGWRHEGLPMARTE